MQRILSVSTMPACALKSLLLKTGGSFCTGNCGRVLHKIDIIKHVQSKLNSAMTLTSNASLHSWLYIAFPFYKFNVSFLIGMLTFRCHFKGETPVDILRLRHKQISQPSEGYANDVPLSRCNTPLRVCNVRFLSIIITTL